MALKKQITAAQVVKALNDALRVDDKAVNALFNIRIPVQPNLRDNGDAEGFYTKSLSDLDNPVVVGPDDCVGILGIINGLFGTSRTGYGRICYAVSDDHSIESGLPPIQTFFILKDPNQKSAKSKLTVSPKKHKRK